GGVSGLPGTGIASGTGSSGMTASSDNEAVRGILITIADDVPEPRMVVIQESLGLGECSLGTALSGEDGVGRPMFDGVRRGLGQCDDRGHARAGLGSGAGDGEVVVPDRRQILVVVFLTVVGHRAV